VTATYTFAVTCPQCGGPVEHQAASTGRDVVATRAVARCRPCGCHLLIEVTVRRQAVATPHELRRRAAGARRNEVLV